MFNLRMEGEFAVVVDFHLFWIVSKYMHGSKELSRGNPIVQMFLLQPQAQRGIRLDAALDHAVPNWNRLAVRLTEMVLAGNLAVRLGKKIDWDMENKQARGVPEARDLIKRTYREGWEPKLT